MMITSTFIRWLRIGRNVPETAEFICFASFSTLFRISMCAATKNTNKQISERDQKQNIVICGIRIFNICVGVQHELSVTSCKAFTPALLVHYFSFHFYFLSTRNFGFGFRRKFTLEKNMRCDRKYGSACCVLCECRYIFGVC